MADGWRLNRRPRDRERAVDLALLPPVSSRESCAAGRCSTWSGRHPERFEAPIFNDTAAVPAGIAEADLWRGLGDQARQEDVASIVPFLIKDRFTGDTRMNDTDRVEYIGSLME